MEQKTVYYASQDGRYIGAYVGFKMRPIEIPADAVEVDHPPVDGQAMWDASRRQWIEPSKPTDDELADMMIDRADPVVRALISLVPDVDGALKERVKMVIAERKEMR